MWFESFSRHRACKNTAAGDHTLSSTLPQNDKEPTTSESSKLQVAIRKIYDPDRKLDDDDTLPTTQKGK